MSHNQHQHFGGHPQYPPQPGYGPPPGSQYQQPPYPPHSSYPLQGQYPPQQHGYPPSHGYQQGPPPQAPYGHPPPLQQGFGFQQGIPQNFGHPSRPSPGYDLHAPVPSGGAGAKRDAAAIYAAMDRPGTDERQLIQVLSKPDPEQMRVLVEEFKNLPKRKKKHDIPLQKWIDDETSGYLKEGLLALVRGPLIQDVYLLHKGIDGPGTNESFLNDILCGRSNADIRAIKELYRKTYNSDGKGKDLVAAVKSDLSMKTETLFEMILAANRAEESAPYDHNAVERDAMELQRAMSNLVGKDTLTVCSILTSRSDNQIRGISEVYQQKFATSLAKTVKSKFSDHMEDALLLIIGRATDSVMTTAEQLEETMKGLGTKDELLVQRIVRLHWDRAQCDQVKRAYRHRYNKDLIARVKGEVSGDVERLLVACLE